MLEDFFKNIKSFFNGFFSVLGVALTVIASFFPIFSFEIITDPVVFECGGDNYVIMWETSSKGTGYVTYEYNGEEKKVWDVSNGNVKTDDTVHIVEVPKNELRGNTYKAVSQYVAFRFGYNAYSGKIAETEEIQFNGIEKEDDINILAVSDTHNLIDPVLNSVSYFEEKADMIVLNGDIADEAVYKTDFTQSILSLASKLSKGSVPVVYVRGNHETRGEYAAHFIDYFPTVTGEFYFTFDFGPISAVVLDGGEDISDDNEDFKGFIDFTSYRNEELKWINSLDKNDFNGKYKIVLSHYPYLDNHFGHDWATPLKNLDMDFLIAGHYHISTFTDGDLPVFINGGKRNDGTFVSSMININDNKIHMKAIDNQGITVFDKTAEI